MTRPKQIIVGVATVACTGVVLHMTTHHGHAMAGSPKKLASYAAAAAFPGNATPENALQSLGWAADKGDLKLLREGVTPEIQKMLDGGGPNMPEHAIRVAGELGGAKILNKEVLSDGQVLLYVQPEGKDSPRRILMEKVDNGWKFAALVPESPLAD